MRQGENISNIHKNKMLFKNNTDQLWKANSSFRSYTSGMKSISFYYSIVNC